MRKKVGRACFEALIVCTGGGGGNCPKACGIRELVDLPLFFGFLGSLNDINVLNRFHLLARIG
jgi:hypothetical protein